MTLAGVRAQVRPLAGLIVEVRLTTPLNPWRAVTMTVEVPAAPASTVIVVGLEATVKS